MLTMTRREVPRTTAFAKQLRALRRKLGELTQKQMADRLGVSLNTYHLWENSKQNPSSTARTLIKLLKDGKI